MKPEEINCLVSNIIEYVCDVKEEQIYFGWASNIRGPNYGKKMLFVGYVGRDKAEQIYSIMGGEIQEATGRYQVVFPLRNVFRSLV